jgi:hypothetical protein
MEQTPTRHGRRISILGLWQPGEGFEYALSQGGFKGKSYIEVLSGAENSGQSHHENVRTLANSMRQSRASRLH